MFQKGTLIVNLIMKFIKSNKALYKSFYFNTNQRKYKLEDQLHHILFILKTGISWRDMNCSIKWQSLYKTFSKLNKLNIFKLSYISLPF